MEGVCGSIICCLFISVCKITVYFAVNRIQVIAGGLAKNIILIWIIWILLNTYAGLHRVISRNTAVADKHGTCKNI